VAGLHNQIREARPDEVELVRTLFSEYADSIDVDLSFQDFERELAALPGFYRVILLAETDTGVAGCVAVREFEPGIAELKRLYVRPAARGSGLGRALSVEALARVRAAGFRSIRLDTLPAMTEATALYRSLGFREIEPYRHNPIAGTRFFELKF
jgi:ribosomal protein S18 acetylase RimI-like enzyme